MQAQQIIVSRSENNNAKELTLSYESIICKDEDVQYY